MHIPAPTDRLTLRRATLDDAAFLLELMNSPGWLENIGDRGVHTLQDARDYLRDKILPSYATPGCGTMLCVLKGTNTVIGNTGVYDRPGLELPDFGFAFLPEYHGRGYAHEASVSNLAYAAAHGLTELLAITIPSNAPSLALLGKLGFSREPELIRLTEDGEALVQLRWRA